MTTEQLLEEAQLEKLTYFQNSEQINSSRQYLQVYFFPEGLLNRRTHQEPCSYSYAINRSQGSLGTETLQLNSVFYA